MEVVERVTTPLTPFQMAAALVAGHVRYFGSKPSSARLAVAWSQCAHEHAQGAKLYNFNFGNVTAAATYDGAVYVMHVPPPDPPVLRFRAFDSPEEGAADYWRILSNIYAPTLPLFDAGKAYEAADLLGRLGYYTDTRERYAHGVANWAAWYARELAPSFVDELAGDGHPLSEAERREILANLLPKDGRRVDDPIFPSPDTRPEGFAALDELEPAKTRKG